MGRELLSYFLSSLNKIDTRPSFCDSPGPFASLQEPGALSKQEILSLSVMDAPGATHSLPGYVLRQPGRSPSFAIGAPAFV
jgi:hypothetical protein